MNNLNDCPHCGLPSVICSCKTPDSVYYPYVPIRTDIKIGREKSPAENMGDYEKTTVFIREFMCGQRQNVV